MNNDLDKLYIALISIHGLIRRNNLELGRDADTGGQTLYVLELANALAQHPRVGRVDLITQRVVDPELDDSYQQPIEAINDKLQIVRLDMGLDKYTSKEQIWDHLDNFTDNLTVYFKQQKQLPDILHSHYADAGYVGTRLAHSLGIPLIHTGHSLGRVKRHRLLASGLSSDEIEKLYAMTRRIEAEEEVLATAKRIITSTHQEIEEQYELYDFYQPSRMRVIPPGTDLKKFTSPRGTELDSDFYSEIKQHLEQPDKPIILALSRPDKRKNIISLLEAYGQSPKLQSLANLIIIAGNRDDINELNDGARDVFIELLIAIDHYDLYGKVVMPKHHNRSQVPEIYRIAAASRGVFVNPALTEPFGLTLIEAAASGLPIIATEDGGPRDIIANCNNGLLIDPLEPNTIATAILQLLTDRNRWQQYAENGLKGVKEHYAWPAHAEQYIQLIEPIIKGSDPISPKPFARRETLYANRAIVSDLDQNLVGDDEALHRLIDLLRQHRKSTKFIIATGRRFDSALKLLKKLGIPEPDILITSSGTEIHYAPKLATDIAWSQHIDFQWTPHRIKPILETLPGIERQTKTEQSQFKLSYYINPEEIDLEQIKSLLHQKEQSVNVIQSFGQYLDILPVRASKGQALRYVAERWQIPLHNIFVAGGSSADEDMMRGNTLATAITNRHKEDLAKLEVVEGIYFTQHSFAKGIMEALDYYDFFGSCKQPGNEEST